MVHARRSCRSNWRDIALEPAGAPALLLAARAATAPSLDLRPAAKLANSSPLCGKSQQVDHLPPVRREKSRHPQFSVELIKVESISKENRDGVLAVTKFPNTGQGRARGDHEPAAGW